MAYSVEKLLIPDWRNVDVGGKYVHAFIFPISSNNLLPPGDYCATIEKCAPAIVRNHSTASIWVQVDSPGLWYPLEVRRALSHVKNIAVAVTRSGSDLRISDFSNCMPYLSNSRISSPPFAKNWVSPVDENPLACLRVLARLGQGLTKEIASLADFCIRTTQDALNSLEERKLISHVYPAQERDAKKLYSKKYPYWILKRSGLRVALRSWGVAPGVRFSSRLEEQHGVGEGIRHKTASRSWLASLKKSYEGLADVWAGWTEVSIPEMRLTPDALAWGKMEGRETLFWCEVESGHLSTQETAAKLLRRLRIASRYANQMEMKLVFGVLTVPAVRDSIPMAFLDIDPNAAVILADWGKAGFGKLPSVRWGRVTMESEVQQQV